MHHKAPRSCSATCIAKHFRSRGSPLTRLPRGGGARRRAGWEGSKGKKGSLALDRLLHPAQVALHSSFVLPAQSVYLHFRGLLLSSPSSRPFYPLTWYFVSCSPSTLPSVPRRQIIAMEVGNFSVYTSCRHAVRVAFSLSRTYTLYTNEFHYEQET